MQGTNFLESGLKRASAASAFSHRPSKPQADSTTWLCSSLSTARQKVHPRSSKNLASVFSLSQDALKAVSSVDAPRRTMNSAQVQGTWDLYRCGMPN